MHIQFHEVMTKSSLGEEPIALHLDWKELFVHQLLHFVARLLNPNFQVLRQFLEDSIAYDLHVTI